MIWPILALTAAVCTASRDVIIKSAMRPGDEAMVAFLVFGTSALILVPAGLLTGGRVLATSFWPALLVSGTLNVAASLMITRAVHVSDISLVAPLQSATPVFMIPVGWLILGELPGPGGALGIVVIAAGAWVLGTAAPRAAVAPVQAPAGEAIRAPARTPLHAPLRALAADPGARLMLGVAALFAVSGSVDKIGVAASAPVLWAGALSAWVALALAPVVLHPRRRGRLRHLAATAGGRLTVGGVVMSVGVAAQMSALPMTQAAYVIAVKRTSVLFSVVAGGVLFREGQQARRLAGAVVMLAGFALVTLLG